jgi:ABC-2 type transport system permease protein
MPHTYSQLHAAFALAKASLIAMLRSPTSVVFSLLFPVIFIVVFGSMVDNSIVQLKIVLAPGCDTTNPVYKAISSISNITVDTKLNMEEATAALQKGRLTAILDIRKIATETPLPEYDIYVTSSASSVNQNTLLQTLLKKCCCLN